MDEIVLAAVEAGEQQRITELEADRDRLSADVQRLADELAAALTPDPGHDTEVAQAAHQIMVEAQLRADEVVAAA